MKKLTYNRVFFYILVVAWAALTVLNFAAPKKDFSENENRYLASFPKFTLARLVNGDFMADVENYINDHFVFRDGWVAVQSSLEYASGKRENSGVYIGKGALLSIIDEPDGKSTAKNIEAINYFASQINVPVSLMIVPSASEIQPEKLPDFAVTWSQRDVIADIYSQCEGVKCVSVYETLKEHSADYIYYRTDHHWTTYGSYLAYVEYCRALGLLPHDYVAETVSNSFNGTLYSKSGVRFIKSDTIESYKLGFNARCDVYSGGETKSYDSVYFDEYLDVKDKYAYFLGTNQPIVTIYRDTDSDGDNAKKLLVFKDSYAHCMAPMLLENYSQVTLVDLRYFRQQLNSVIDVADYDDVLFLYGIDSFVNSDDIYMLKFLYKPTADKTADS